MQALFLTICSLTILNDKEETIYEIADLAYHVMVMMVEQGIQMKDVTAELAKRHVVDHKVKQERMK